MNFKSDNNIPSSIKGYVLMNGETELSSALEHSFAALESSEMVRFKDLGLLTYAPDKWTINELIQHLIDTERIMSYRALRFARKDKTPLAGFEENDYTPASNANQRSFDELLAELKIVRQSSILLFRSFTDEILLRTGIANGNEMSVLALGLSISGHQLHHFKVIRERYLPLIK